MPAPTRLYLRPTAETRIVIEVERQRAWSAPTPENVRRAAEFEIGDLPRNLGRRASVEQDYEWTDGASSYSSLYEALVDTCVDDDAGWPHYGVRYKSSKHDDSYTVRSGLTFPQLAEHAFRHPWDFTVTFAYPPLTPAELRFLDHAKVCGLATFDTNA